MPVRVTRAKNIEFALEVVAVLKREGLKVKLVLTGPPDPHDERSMEYFHALQKLRDDLGLHSEMRFRILIARILSPWMWWPTFIASPT
jgi:glycosyltransferase involved in cell wall biosynthesis